MLINENKFKNTIICIKIFTEKNHIFALNLLAMKIFVIEGLPYIIEGAYKVWIVTSVLFVGSTSDLRSD